MTASTARKSRRQVRAMASHDLQVLVDTLEPEIRRAHSLMECAKQELRRRAAKGERKAA